MIDHSRRSDYSRVRTTDSRIADGNDAKVISLTGLPGIVLGLVATGGALVANAVLESELPEGEKIRYLLFDALGVMLIASGAAVILVARDRRRRGFRTRAHVSIPALVDLAIPLFTGGLIAYLLLTNRMFQAIPGALLLFYGLGLVASAKYAHPETRVLGIVDIALGISALLYPDHALMYWAIGFGIAHILYGALLYFKYELT
jgi:hypothetical protein